MVELRIGLINNIERKFIPAKKEVLESYLKKLKYIEEYELTQTYKGKVKYRCYKDGDTYKYTRNTKMQGVTDVIEISKDDFTKVLNENNNRKIKKIRKYYLDGKYEIDVDYFLEPIEMVMIEVESDLDILSKYEIPKGFIEVTDNPKFENVQIFNGSIISNNTIIEGTDGVGKTTAIIELLKEGIICQDRDMDVISPNMMFEISMEERCMRYQKYLKQINKKIIILVNNDKEELEKRINSRENLSKFDNLAYEFNKLYFNTFKYMQEKDMLENKLFLIDCTNLSVSDEVKEIRDLILNKNI